MNFVTAYTKKASGYGCEDKENVIPADAHKEIWSSVSALVQHVSIQKQLCNKYSTRSSQLFYSFANPFRRASKQSPTLLCTLNF